MSNRFKDQLVIIYEFDHNQERYHKTQGHQEFPPESVTKKQTIIEGVQSSNILSFCVKKTHISALDSVRGTLSILLVTASPADSPRSIKQTFNGLWTIFNVFFFVEQNR